jgi:hypothetical protein
MSFRIFASGTGHFQHLVENSIDGDDFDAIKTVSIISHIEPNVTSVAGAAVDQFGPSADMKDGMAALATKQFLHLLVDSVSFLATRPNVNKISVTTRKKSFIGPDRVKFASYDFQPGDSPGTEFFRAISPSLVATDFNSGGVLLALTIAISKYSEKINNTDAVVMLNIELTR